MIREDLDEVRLGALRDFEVHGKLANTVLWTRVWKTDTYPPKVMRLLPPLKP